MRGTVTPLSRCVNRWALLSRNSELFPWDKTALSSSVKPKSPFLHNQPPGQWWEMKLYRL